MEQKVNLHFYFKIYHFPVKFQTKYMPEKDQQN